MAQVFIALGDPDLRKLLQMLLRDYYMVNEEPSVVLAMELLSISPDRRLVFLQFDLPSASGEAILARVEHDSALRRHQFLLLTLYPEGLTPEVSRLLVRLQIPLIRMPFDVDDFLAQVEDAQKRVAASMHESA